MQTLFQSFQKIGILTVIIAVAFAANFAYGQWTNPTADPVGGNIDPPVNTSGNNQIKSGALAVNGLSVFGADQIISSPNPRLKLDDTTGNNGVEWWVQANNGNMYLLDNTPGAVAYPWPSNRAPLTLRSELDGGQDWARFADQVRANEYCDADGGNCIVPGGTGDELPTCADGDTLTSVGGVWACDNNNPLEFCDLYYRWVWDGDQGIEWQSVNLSNTTGTNNGQFSGRSISTVNEECNNGVGCGMEMRVICGDDELPEPPETYSWQTGNWSWAGAPLVTAACTGWQSAVQTRSVTCERNSDGATVADSFCGGGRPASSDTVFANNWSSDC